ncbi:Rasrelated protein Rab5, putative [Acanthamoeba castellanii str. Neff]|uniref:Rasrelated protein Rab5, putative n=1 Tax=Acanthamoeba castellanii (strain ATCC 30010 / Neff) TaxID=1257118 RepID=L8GKG8_ACACF|nr:Rasrelated protein Rab5, putative [Acanthamoeba castellanii str. Neff]ELR12676.1 Rasrelated protein Rab5, putative [Acanthamoeba castellanii str. Neff]
MTEREKSETGNKPKIASIDAKIVLLGDTGVGKTSLALRFVQDAFSSRTAPTVGASFLTKVLLISDCKIKLRIWDTAGQERFRSLAPMYYRGACAAVIAFDITREESFKKMQDWVKELQINLSEEIILVVVGNKADLEKFRKVSKATAEDYARNIGALGYVEASAKTGDGIEEIFMNIAHKLNEKRLASPDGMDSSRSPSGGRRLVDDGEGDTGRRCCT